MNAFKIVSKSALSAMDDYQRVAENARRLRHEYVRDLTIRAIVGFDLLIRRVASRAAGWLEGVRKSSRAPGRSRAH